MGHRACWHLEQWRTRSSHFLEGAGLSAWSCPGQAHVHEAVSPPRSMGPAPGTWAPAVTRGWPPPAARGRTPGPGLCGSLSSRSPVSSAGGRTRPPLGAYLEEEPEVTQTEGADPRGPSPLLPPSPLSPSSLFPKSQDASDFRTRSRLTAPRRGAQPARDPSAPLGPAELWSSLLSQATPDVEHVAQEHV